MDKKKRFLSLVLALLMVVAAAISVNKSIFGHALQRSATEDVEAGSSVNAIVKDEDGVTIVHTQDLPGCVNGYAGPVPLDIYITDGKISDVKALPNSETPSFFSRASELLKSWVGETPEKGMAMKVDAVSGATFSSSAIINNVNIGLAYYEGSDARRGAAVPVKVWVAFAVALAACVVPLFVKNRIYHVVQMIANVVVLGFWSGQFLDYSLILKYTSSGFTWPVTLVAVVMLIAAFIYPLFGHPQHYCTHICPLGSAQQLMAQVCGYKINISPNVIRVLDWFRKLLWAALMLLLWTDCLTGWMDLELFQAFQFESASWGIITAAVVFVLLSAVVTRPYCRFVCPTGSLFKRAENIG